MLVSFVTLSNISGTRLTALSIALSLETICLIVTSPSLTTRNATGLIVIPAPPAPPKSSTLFFDGKSEPPEAKPYVTFDTGMIVRPSGRLIGSPIIVLTSTKSLTFTIVVLRIQFADFSIVETPSLSIKIIYLYFHPALLRLYSHFLLQQSGEFFYFYHFSF